MPRNPRLSPRRNPINSQQADQSQNLTTNELLARFEHALTVQMIRLLDTRRTLPAASGRVR